MTSADMNIVVIASRWMKGCEMFTARPVFAPPSQPPAALLSSPAADCAVRGPRHAQAAGDDRKILNLARHGDETNNRFALLDHVDKVALLASLNRGFRYHQRIFLYCELGTHAHI